MLYRNYWKLGIGGSLGVRLRIEPNGKLEIHVPRPFTAQQSAVAFTHNTFDMGIGRHPAACRLPKPTDGPSTQPISDDFWSFIVRADHPATIEEMIRLYVPQLSLHITSFTDATLVTLTWLHTLMDAMGSQALVSAWSSVLAGQDEEVPLVLGTHKDILADLSPNNDTFMGRIVELSPGRKFPEDTFARLQKRIREEATESARTSDQKPFVSDGDILTAWATHTVASSMPEPCPITLVSIVNTRFRLPLLTESGGVYLQNMALAAYAFLSAQLAKGPIGPIALSHRGHLVEQQTLGLLKIVRQDIKSAGSPSLFCGDTNASVLFVNNLTKMGLIKAANFGSALLSQGDKRESRSNPPGRMVTFLNYIHPNWGRVNSLFIAGKDYDGNYWLRGDLPPQAWKIIDKELRDM
ncbi:hypothetical protein BDV30DRAFT_240184 [Aspergillus minisclerotigenes]|uniref:Transferase family-domain-containing protein n=1 Tax=Aspergillus minisclerotigenes TaxID=656917 RepID=A0A5N6IYW8_9EURO|nr:hypothetical protein BDV30DRAFT_240184 [Aspergillus minisclerotigenes]